MSIEPVDKYFGISLSEWIERTPNELEFDAVGFWQLVATGRDSFGLEGNALKDFAKRSIIALLKKGAVPVRPSEDEGKLWEEQAQYGNGLEEVAHNIIREWESSRVDPDYDGIWFALIDYRIGKPQS